MIKFTWILLLVTSVVTAQTLKPDFHKSELWSASNRHSESVMEDGKKVIRFIAEPNDGFIQLKNYEFSNGSIEFDVKGKNVMNENFIGIAFHIEDEKKYDVIYFRPFNFMNADTARRWHAVQYVSHPEYTWPRLRADTPLKYENKIRPVPDPDNWFHAKITVNGKKIKVYVNHSPTPTLEVEKLGTRTSGKIGLWAGPMTSANLANLEITPDKK